MNYMKYRKSGLCMSGSEKTRDLNIYGTVKVGERGQIVIPSKAREDFEIKPGDLLLVVAGMRRGGIGLVKADAMKEFATRILKGLETEEKD
jgi:AbrB family looped-hinge helix DNA binding protein